MIISYTSVVNENYNLHLYLVVPWLTCIVHIYSSDTKHFILFLHRKSDHLIIFQEHIGVIRLLDYSFKCIVLTEYRS